MPLGFRFVEINDISTIRCAARRKTPRAFCVPSEAYPLRWTKLGGGEGRESLRCLSFATSLLSNLICKVRSTRNLLPTTTQAGTIISHEAERIRAQHHRTRGAILLQSSLCMMSLPQMTHNDLLAVIPPQNHHLHPPRAFHGATVIPLKLKCIRSYHTFGYILSSTTQKSILPHRVPCSSNAIIYSGLSNSASS